MTMKAAVLTAPGRFELREVAVPEVGADQVLVRIARTGICGTDIHMFHGHYAADRLPLIPGHEFCGTISELGANVSHLAIGMRVVVDINVGCGSCYWCRRNEVLNCSEVSQIGIHQSGAFAEYVAVPARLAIPVAADIADEVLALTEPVACVVRAARKAGVSFGQSVVIFGAGPIGNLQVQMMRLVGAAPIIVTDLSPERCQMALAAGADAAVSDPSELAQTVLRLTGGRGADHVIESVGSKRLYEQAFNLIRRGGHVTFFGITAPGETVPVDILRTVLEENSLKGSVAAMGEDMHDAVTLLSHGRFRTADFTKSEFDLDQIQQAFESIADRPQHLKTQIVIAA